MTSEVVVMNRLGIALASDSAATVYIGGKPKFYHADKLFMLSNYHPVGAMVYNNSSLLGIPWETILKKYRSELGTTQFDKLEDYAEGLIKYLTDNASLFPADVQSHYYLQLVKTLFRSIRDDIKNEILASVQEDSADVSVALRIAQEKIIKKTIDEWKEKPDVSTACFDSDVGTKMAGQVSGEISKLIADFFPGLTASYTQLLYDLARYVVTKESILPESLSGLVIAGYGAKEHFPVMQEYELGEIFLGKLKYKCIETHKIGLDKPSIVKPFAQSEMVTTFLEGISPALEYRWVREIVNVMMKSPDGIIDGMPGVGRKRKEEYKSKVQDISEEAVLKLIRRLKDYREKKHLQPILQSIEFLPKNELAHVASSLVNLSSFQKRISIDEDETVGGPIDVAVISKGDGFVWIDRKHYFRAELNRHFFRNSSPNLMNERNQDKNENESDKG